MNIRTLDKKEYFFLMNSRIRELQTKKNIDLKEMLLLSKQIKDIRKLLKIGTKI